MLPITLKWIDIVDIILVSIIVYHILLWFHGTRATELTRGLFLILGLYIISFFAGLHTIIWLMQKVTPIVLILFIVVFQPELRQALERLGRRRFFSHEVFSSLGEGISFVKFLTTTVEALSEEKVGSLIVLERNATLHEYIETGVRLNALFSEDILRAIFNPKGSLHDGAVIIQGNHIIAARCWLPLTSNPAIDKGLGSRHRAALGISELTDAIIIVVSEHSGTISVAREGNLKRYFTKETLEEYLFNIYKSEVRKEKFNLANVFRSNKWQIKR
jgi:diadenylate cyclase